MIWHAKIHGVALYMPLVYAKICAQLLSANPRCHWRGLSLSRLYFWEYVYIPFCKHSSESGTKRKNWHRPRSTVRDVESQSGAWGNILAGPSGEFFCILFFNMEHSSVRYILGRRRGSPNVVRPEENFSFPSPLSTACLPLAEICTFRLPF